MLKLKRFSEGVWFDYPKGGRFKIRAATPKHYLDYRQQNKKKVAVEKPGGGFEIVEDIDEAAVMWEVLNYCLQEWSEVEVDGTIDQKEIKESILNNVELQNWIIEKSQQVATGEEKEFEGELKNLKGSQSG